MFERGDEFAWICFRRAGSGEMCSMFIFSKGAYMERNEQKG